MNKQLSPDKNAIADYIHLSKYAQYIPAKKRRETFNETVDRVANMHKERFPQLARQIDEAFKLVHQKRILPSMRSMQFAGEPIKERNERMYNCSFTLIDRSKVFGEILYLLLCGVGVGFSIQKQHIESLPVMKKINKELICHHVIEDTIEGWANSITALINSYRRGYYIEFGYNKIRPVGSQLKSGGRAPGHLDLKEALETTRNILSKVENRKLKSIECYDIICHISKAVLAGGIRRSSLIALFSDDDNDMFFAKHNDNFNYKGLNYQRALCNNSVVLNPETCSYAQFCKIIELNKTGLGEPGFIFIKDTDCGVNPCGEIGINPIWTHEDGSKETGFGFCNLVEINATGCKNFNDFFEACQIASFIATLQANYTNFPYLGKVVENITKRDALIGVSITGMRDASWIFNETILREGAQIVKDVNHNTAKMIKINPAIRCTCIKPGGTSSLELGCISSGIHSHPSKYYYRRITANPLEVVAQFFKKYNPLMVEEKPDGDWCIKFPIKSKGATYKELNAIDFLKSIFSVYKNWILPTHKNKEEPSHNISCTIVVEDHEWEKIEKYIWKNRDKIRCLSFLPSQAYLSIPFMPNEPTRPGSEYEQLVKSYQPIDYTLMKEDEDTTLRGAACDNDRCGIEERTFIKGNGYRIFEGLIFTHKAHDFQFMVDDLWFQFIAQYNNYYIGKRISK